MFGAILFFLIIALTVIFQVSFLPEIFPSGAVPSLILAVAIYWAMKEDFSKALPKVVFIGFLYDIFSFYPVGANVISLSAVAFATNSFTKRFVLSQGSWKIGTVIVLSVLGTIINSLSLLIISEASRYVGNEQFYVAGDFFSPKLVIVAAFNSLLFIIIQPVIGKIEKIARLYFGKKSTIK